MFRIPENRIAGGRCNIGLSRDKRWIIDNDDGHTVRLYRWQWNDLVAAAHQAIRRDSFTEEELAEFFPEAER